MSLILNIPVLISTFVMLYFFVNFVIKNHKPNYRLYKTYLFFATVAGFILATLTITIAWWLPWVVNGVLLFVAYTLVLYCSTWIFEKMDQLVSSRLINFIYYMHYFGLSFIFLAIGRMSNAMDYDTAVYGIPIFFGTIILAGMLYLFVLVCSKLTRFSSRYTGSKSKSASTKGSSKIDYYRQQGLSTEEIHYFREQMATARDQIITIERTIGQTAKLRAIATKHDIVNVAQSFFQSIVKYPAKLSQAGSFLYKTLPSLVDLIAKYNEISGHVAKNKQTYLILEKTAKVIDDLCQQMIDEYFQFHHDIYQDLDDEIKLAELNLKRQAQSENESYDTDNESQPNTNMSDIDQLIQETEDMLSDMKKEENDD